MTGKVKNTWILSDDKINGLKVERCSAGYNFEWSEPDTNGFSEVTKAIINYRVRELYPNGIVCKQYSKSYTLENLKKTDIDETHYMDALNVLDGFIAKLGQSAIVDPIELTLSDTSVLPLEASDNYPLHLNTRPILER